MEHNILEAQNSQLKEQIEGLKKKVIYYQDQIASLEASSNEMRQKLMRDVQTRIDKIQLEAKEEIERFRTESQLDVNCMQSELAQIKNTIILCPDFVAYASIALEFVNVVEESLRELDEEIKPFTDNDDANYFYVRRRLKFLSSIGNRFVDMRKWTVELELLAEKGFIVVGSELYKAIDGKVDKNSLGALEYYLYNALFRDIAGPSIILVREMLAMPVYVEIEKCVNFEKIVALKSRLLDLLDRMGYLVIDVELFKSLPMSDLIDCIEYSEVELPSVRSGDVYEIVKLAVLYGNTNDKTEVKIKN